MDRRDFYLGNQKLKRVNVPVNYTKEQVKEFVKCSRDPKYFITRYVKIINVDQGLIPFKMWPFQRDMVDTAINNRFSIFKLSRQVGKTQIAASIILWYILFHENYSVAILANKLAQAKEILGRIQLGYENLPKWMQQGVVEWNKTNISLENGSKVLAAATSSSAIRGGTFNCVSGDNIATVKINGEIQKITMRNLYNLIANSSKYILRTNSNGVEEYVHRQQIHKVVQQSNQQRLQYDGLYQRETSHHSEMYWWVKRQLESCVDANQAPYFSPQTSSENDFWFNTEKNDFRIFNDSKHKILNNTTISKTINIDSRTTEIYSDWQKIIRISQTKNFYSKYRQIKKSAKNFRAQTKDIKSFNWFEENTRARPQDKQQSRKNKKNSRATSWYETIRRSKTENERSKDWLRSLEQRKEKNKNLEIQVLTEDGFKDFVGFKKTLQQNTIKLITENSNIVCTPDHEIFTIDGYKPAKDCLNKQVLNSSGYYEQVLSIEQDTNQDVYDFLEVFDTHSYYCNDILVHQCLYLDEFAFVPAHIQGEFFASVYPTISSGNTTKIVVTSTPKGLNIFYKMWMDAENGKNSFVPFSAHWSDVPGRDEKWREETIKNTSEQQFREEYETEFIGSTNTLISANKLLQMAGSNPLRSDENFAIYEDPTDPKNKNKLYVLVVDTSRGVGNDYSAFVVFDVSGLPYRVVARYKNNEISPLIFPNVIEQFAKLYNNAYVCVEVNDIGQQVADILYRELEYENMIFSQFKGRAGQSLSSGFGLKPALGVRTTKLVKRVGCTNLKTLVELEKLIIEDQEIINELFQFVETGDTYQAEVGAHDDLTMCCVLFSWLTQQPYFKDWTDTNARQRLVEENFQLIDEDLLPMVSTFGDNLVGTDQIEDISYREFERFLRE